MAVPSVADPAYPFRCPATGESEAALVGQAGACLRLLGDYGIGAAGAAATAVFDPDLELQPDSDLDPVVDAAAAADGVGAGGGSQCSRSLASLEGS